MLAAGVGQHALAAHSREKPPGGGIGRGVEDNICLTDMTSHAVTPATPIASCGCTSWMSARSGRMR